MADVIFYVVAGSIMAAVLNYIWNQPETVEIRIRKRG